MIHAKPVVPDQFWILRKDDRKVGNIQVDSQGYAVSIDNQVVHYRTLDMLQQRLSVNFETFVDTSQPDPYQSHGFPTTDPVHSAVWDIKRQIPLWKKESRSQSWHAAGWYQIKRHRNWTSINCPKLIILERYRYRGPFHSREEAEST
jgi:hypothetical protein